MIAVIALLECTVQDLEITEQLDIARKVTFAREVKAVQLLWNSFAPSVIFVKQVPLSPGDVTMGPIKMREVVQVAKFALQALFAIIDMLLQHISMKHFAPRGGIALMALKFQFLVLKGLTVIKRV